VSDWCWMPAPEIARDIDQRPERYTIWFQKFRREFWGDIVKSLQDQSE